MKSVRQEARGEGVPRKQLVLSLELSRSSLNGMISEQACCQTTPVCEESVDVSR
jgi:hypothetical protein